MPVSYRQNHSHVIYTLISVQVSLPIAHLFTNPICIPELRLILKISSFGSVCTSAYWMKTKSGVASDWWSVFSQETHGTEANIFYWSVSISIRLKYEAIFTFAYTGTTMFCCSFQTGSIKWSDNVRLYHHILIFTYIYIYMCCVYI